MYKNGNLLETPRIIVKKIIGRIITFDRVMFLRHRFFKQPAQTTTEIKLIKKLFGSFKDKKISVFEYGSGYSTLYYARYLRSKGYQFEWHAVDNSEAWSRKVKAMIKAGGLDRHISIHLKEFKPFWEKPNWDFSRPVERGHWEPTLDAEKEYIDFPNMFPSKFDIILIDGRFRRRCLLAAKQCLKPGGIVILHDAHKERYHPSLKYYQYHTFINGGRIYPGQGIRNLIWFGSNDNMDLINRFKENKA